MGVGGKFTGGTDTDATNSEPVRLIIRVGRSNIRRPRIQVVSIGTTNYGRGPVVAIVTLVVQATCIPVVVARVDVGKIGKMNTCRLVPV